MKKKKKKEEKNGWKDRKALKRGAMSTCESPNKCRNATRFPPSGMNPTRNKRDEDEAAP